VGEKKKKGAGLFQSHYMRSGKGKENEKGKGMKGAFTINGLKERGKGESFWFFVRQPRHERKKKKKGGKKRLTPGTNRVKGKKRGGNFWKQPSLRGGSLSERGGRIQALGRLPYREKGGRVTVAGTRRG